MLIWRLANDPHPPLFFATVTRAYKQSYLLLFHHPGDIWGIVGHHVEFGEHVALTRVSRTFTMWSLWNNFRPFSRLLRCPPKTLIIPLLGPEDGILKNAAFFEPFSPCRSLEIEKVEESMLR